MRIRRFVSLIMMAGVLAVPAAAPLAAQTRTHHKKVTAHRQRTKNTWRNGAYAGAGLAAVGLATHNKTLLIGGLAGGAYSASRYEHDRRSQSRANQARARARARAAYDRRHHPVYHHNVYVMRHGHRYVRRLRILHGKKHYVFVRG